MANSSLLLSKWNVFIFVFIPIFLHSSHGHPTFLIRQSTGVNSNLIDEYNPQNVVRMSQNALPKPDDTAKYYKSPGVAHDNFNTLQNSTVTEDTPFSAVTCIICRGIVGLIQDLLAQAKTKAEIAKEVTKYCIKFNIEDGKVCRGIVNVFKEEVLTVFDKVAISKNLICGRIFGEACGGTNSSGWNVTFPDKQKPPVFEPKLPKPGSPVIKILHISDLHIDLDYMPGAETNCGEPLCCRKDNGPAKNGTGAGYWGHEVGCDIPKWTFENAMEHISKTHTDIEFIYWTGDLPGHNVWSQSREGQISILKYMTKKLLQYFPNIPVLPSLGNHESNPVNSYPPPFVKGNDSMSWLYEPTSYYWSLWLPQDTMATIRKGGYYTVLLKPGFRVVSLNMNYCNNQNWWLLLNDTDPADELKWLITVLQQSEDNKEKVHILGHIPPGTTDCTPDWSGNFNRIVNRYESTITGLFFGHYHQDTYEIFYDEKNQTRPIHLAYIAPSLTTFSYLNPGYRLYAVDGFYNKSSFYTLDHETHIFNMTLANLPGNKPQWFKEYSAKEAYNLPSLFPKDWDALTTTFANNRTAFDVFYRYNHKLFVDPSTCDDDCYKDTVCQLKNSNSGVWNCNATMTGDGSYSDNYAERHWQEKVC